MKKLIFISPVLFYFTSAFAQFPATPKNLAAQKVGTTYQLSWNDQATNETNYQIDRAEANSPYVKIAVVPANSTFYTDASINNNYITYHYRIKAIGLEGDSEFTYESAQTSASIDCGASACYPENCSIGYPGTAYKKTYQANCEDCLIDISFNRFSTESLVDQLTIYDGNSVYAPSLGKYSGPNLPPTIHGTGKALTFSFSPIYSGKGWQFTSSCVQRPTRPEILSYRELYSSEVTLTWADNSSDETGFKLDISKSSTFQTITSYTLPPNTTEYYFTNLDSATVYYFRVRAFNDRTESHYSKIYTITTPGSQFHQVPLFNTGGNLEDFLQVVDFNGDKLYDFVSYVYPFLRVFKNEGNNQFSKLLEIENTAISLLQLVDIDNDLDYDLIYRGDYRQIFLLENTGGSFVRKLIMDSPFGSYDDFGMLTSDFDSDGDADLFIWDKYNPLAAWFKNNHNGEFAFDSVSYMKLRFLDARMMDVNNDGKPDLFANQVGQGKQIFINSGQTFQTLPNLSFGNNNLFPADLDNDGDQDFIISYYNWVQAVINNGSSYTTAYPTTHPFNTPSTAKALTADLDNDGDTDVIFESNDGVTFFINKGNFNFAAITNFHFSKGLNKIIKLVDWNSDSKPDLLINNDGNVSLWLNQLPGTTTVPSRPPQLSSIASNGAVTLKWLTASDDKTSAAGLRYNFFIGKTTNGEEIRPSNSFHDDGRLRLFEGDLQAFTQITINGLEKGAYYWGTQTIDGALLTSPFSFSNFQITTSSYIKPPKGLMVNPWSPYQNNLTWTDDSGNEDGFHILRSTDYWAGYKKISTVSANVNSFNDINLTPGTNYFYRVVAFSSAGKSDMSPVVSCKALPLLSILITKFKTNPTVQPARDGEMQWVDFNGDNRRDFVWTGSGVEDFDPYNAKPLFQAYSQSANDPWSFNQVKFNYKVVGDPNILVTNYSALDWADFDNDGDWDFLLARVISDTSIPYAQIIVMVNDGTNTFQVNVIEQIAYAAPVSSLRWGDFDNDGDYDILASINNKMTRIYRNQGSSFSNFYSLPNGGWAEWIDHNNDGLLDFAVSMGPTLFGDNTFFKCYTNTGSGFQIRDSFAFTNGVISIADPDNDGDEDLFISGFNGSLIGFLENDRIARAFVPRTLGLPVSTASEIGWVDFNNDNKTDLLRTEDAWRYSYIYQNVGSFNFLKQAAIFLPSHARFSVNDVDQDSDLDVFSFGTGPGGPSAAIIDVYENNSKVFKVKPLPPLTLSTVVKNDTTLLTWQRGDSNLNLTFNVRIGTAPGKQDILNSLSDIASGFHRINHGGNARYSLRKFLVGLKAGTYFWSVQAIDQNYQSSNFAQEGSFVVGSPTLLPSEIISVTGVSSKNIKLTLNATPANQSQLLYVSDDGIQFSYLATVQSNIYIHTGLQINHTYYYRTVVTDGASYSLYSSTAQGSTLQSPRIMSSNDLTINEDESLTIQLDNLHVSNSPDYPVNYNLIIQPGTNYSVNGNIVKPSLNFNGFLTIPVRISNQYDTSEVYSLLVKVTAVNDPPQPFSLLTPMNQSDVPNLAAFTWQNAVDVDGDAVSYSLSFSYAGVSKEFTDITVANFDFNIADHPDMWNTGVHWHVTANDLHSEVRSSEVFSFQHLVTAVERNEQNISIYPNPVTEQLTIFSYNHDIIKLTILDSKGATVQVEIKESTANQMRLNTKEIARGLYIVLLTTSNGIATYKLLKE